MHEFEPVTDVEELRALFSDTVLEATLTGGVRARAQYKADGSGQLEAWGDTFPRTWEVREGQVLIGMGEEIVAFDVERSATSPNVYRAHNLKTGEVVVFTAKSDEGSVEVGSGGASSGGAASPSADEIAAELANPNAAVATLNMKFQYRTFDGDLPDAENQSSTTLLFQPAFPFPLESGDSVFFRPAIPILLDQPVFDASEPGFDGDSGLGDIVFDLAYGRTSESGFLTAGGIVSSLPTATDDLGTDRWTLGPELLFGKLTSDYVIGAFPNHQWDIGGSGDVDVNLTTVQLFGTYLPGGGWNVGTSPIITFDHIADEWAVPINLTVGKTVILSGRPWKFSVELNYFVEQPDALGPDLFIGINVAPVVKNFLVGLFD